MSNTRTHLRSLALGLVVAALSGQIGHAQTRPVLDPAWRATGVDTTKPGFIFNLFANSDRSTRPNTNFRTESDLAFGAVSATGVPLENLAAVNAVGAAIGPAAPANPSNAPVQFVITNVINMAKTPDRGSILGDDLIPGMPASNGSTDGTSAEIVTYLQLPVGVINMGVQSDDSFSVAAGPNPQDMFGRAVELGSYCCGPSPQVLFSFEVTQAGIYPFRTIWENGSQDAHIEWFTVRADSTKVLVNDAANGGIPAFRALSNSFPYIKSVPPPRQAERTSRSVKLTLADGTGNAVDDNSVTLQIDGKFATFTKKQRAGSVLNLETAAFDGFQAPGEPHVGALTFKNVSGTYSRTQMWTFYNLENLILPASPVTRENFDSYPEATSLATTVPPGWVATNFTYQETPGFDLTDIKSDAFLNWVMITTDTVFPLEDEVLDNDTNQLINGQPLRGTNWMDGNLIFVASDGRASTTSEGFLAPQCQFVVSKPFNLSTVTNPVLTFSSGARLSIANPDQMTMEYSVDGGTNWLPVIYMRSYSTIILKSDGTYDALAMFNTVNTNQVPRFPDPGTGPLGGKWGDMLAAPISQALAPFIAERNDTRAARRVEAIRLPQASRKSDVRLRLTHLGHCGWEWGVDNIAFYDIASANTGGAQPHIDRITTSNNQVTIQWSGGGTLESSPSLGTPAWTSTGNSSGSFTESLSAAGNKYYRVRQ